MKYCYLFTLFSTNKGFIHRLCGIFFLVWIYYSLRYFVTHSVQFQFITHHFTSIDTQSEWFQLQLNKTHKKYAKPMMFGIIVVGSWFGQPKDIQTNVLLSYKCEKIHLISYLNVMLLIYKKKIQRNCCRIVWRRSLRIENQLVKELPNIWIGDVICNIFHIKCCKVSNSNEMVNGGGGGVYVWICFAIKLFGRWAWCSYWFVFGKSLTFDAHSIIPIHSIVKLIALTCNFHTMFEVAVTCLQFGTNAALFFRNEFANIHVMETRNLQKKKYWTDVA